MPSTVCSEAALHVSFHQIEPKAHGLLFLFCNCMACNRHTRTQTHTHTRPPAAAGGRKVYGSHRLKFRTFSELSNNLSMLLHCQYNIFIWNRDTLLERVRECVCVCVCVCTDSQSNEKQ